MGSKSLIGDQMENRKRERYNPSLSFAAMAILNMTAMNVYIYISCVDVTTSNLLISSYTERLLAMLILSYVCLAGI